LAPITSFAPFIRFGSKRDNVLLIQWGGKMGKWWEA
jgi:hypothetical protein